MEVNPVRTPEHVLSLRLFGSAARNETDAHSDLDVLAVYSGRPSSIERMELHSRVKAVLGEKVELAEYEAGRISEFFRSGHLFAWHLKNESISIAERPDDFFSSLPMPAPYISGRRDAWDFLTLTDSIIESLCGGESSPEFELGILFVATRNFAMCLSAADGSRPVFSRYSPYEADLKVPFPLDRDQFEILIRCRKSSTRGTQSPNPRLDSAVQMAKDVRAWMALCLDEQAIGERK